jgi:phage pi2 protein 07
MSRYFNYTGDDYVAHFGIKGMKWGVRRYQNNDGSLTPTGKTRYTHAQKKTIHQAKKDAEEYARAKMFYGDGAGTRRKLIKSTVNQRSKDSLYKQTFDNELAGKDWAKEVSKAKGERKRKDAKENVAKTARGVKNTLLGNPRAASIAGLAIGSGIVFYAKNKPQIDSFVRSNMNKVMSKMQRN